MPMPARATNHPPTSPWVEIIEQPSSKSTRFRYESENAQGGILSGASSSKEKPTYPTIKVHNHTGACVIVVSLVTADDDENPKPHPHALVGSDCKSEVCTKKVKGSLDNIPFPNLGIQCKKKNQLADSLKLRQQIRVDPFRTGFDHTEKNKLNALDLTAVRLCFQVFLPDSTGKYQKALTPVCSDVIHDKKAAGELNISEYLPVSCCVTGDEPMILLTGKLPKNDIEVRFYEGPSKSPHWEAFGTFTEKDVHQGVAVKIKIPPYTNPNNNRTKKQCFIELRRKGNPNEASQPKKFFYYVQGALNADRPSKRKSEYSAYNYPGKKIKTDTTSDSDYLQQTTAMDVPAVIADEQFSSVDTSLSSGQSSFYMSSGPQMPNGINQAATITYIGQDQQNGLQGNVYPAITGSDEWIPVKASDIKIVRFDNGQYALGPGPTAANQTALARDAADFGFTEDMMEQLLTAQKTDPESDLYIPSNFSECLQDFLVGLGSNVTAPTNEVIISQNNQQPESSSLTRELQSLDGEYIVHNGT